MNFLVPQKPIRVMICAGEISGDMYGAAIIKNMRELCNRPIEFYGIGGDLMKAEGVELFAHASQTGVIGFWEVFKRARFFSGLLKTMTELLVTRKPDLVLTIDYPGFNLRLAKRAHNAGIKTVHYVCPQVWAWHKERIPKIAQVLDRLITIFPFEPALFDGTGLDVVFTGHPLVDQVEQTLSEPNIELAWGEGKRIALFPGSRQNEITRLLPDILAGAALLEERIGKCSFLIPAPTDEIKERVCNIVEKIKPKVSQLEICKGQSRRVLQQADAAVIKSGTSTLEGCLMLCPYLIVYRTSFMTYHIIKNLINDVNHLGIANILAKKTICKEFIQKEITPKSIADELELLLRNNDTRNNMLEEMKKVNSLLGGLGASRRTAAAILEKL